MIFKLYPQKLCENKPLADVIQGKGQQANYQN